MAVAPAAKRSATRALTIEESEESDGEVETVKTVVAEGDAAKRSYSEAAKSDAEESSIAEFKFLLRDIQG